MFMCVWVVVTLRVVAPWRLPLLGISAMRIAAVLASPTRPWWHVWWLACGLPTPALPPQGLLIITTTFTAKVRNKKTNGGKKTTVKTIHFC